MTQTFSELVYVPVLHRELLPSTLPESLRERLLTVWPGLPRPRDAFRSEAFREDLWLTPDFVYTPAQAAACVEDLRHLDEESLSLAAEPEGSGRFSRDEQQALSQFVQTGHNPEPSRRERGVGKMWAQRFLLLGWIQEERVLEMDALADRYRAGAARLMAHLGEDVLQSDEGASQSGEGGQADSTLSSDVSRLIPDMHELFPEDPTSLLASWRFMLELLSAVLPEERLLFSADPRMCAALLEAGLCRESPPESLMALLPPECHEKDIQSRLRWQYASMREILGSLPATPDKPWLDTKRNLLLFVSENSL